MKVEKCNSFYNYRTIGANIVLFIFMTHTLFKCLYVKRLIILRILEIKYLIYVPTEDEQELLRVTLWSKTWIVFHSHSRLWCFMNIRKPGTQCDDSKCLGRLVELRGRLNAGVAIGILTFCPYTVICSGDLYRSELTLIGHTTAAIITYEKQFLLFHY